MLFSSKKREKPSQTFKSNSEIALLLHKQTGSLNFTICLNYLQQYDYEIWNEVYLK